jgi:AraC-like DNA-binding protein
MTTNASYSRIWVNAMISLLNEHGFAGSDIARDCGVLVEDLAKPTDLAFTPAMLMFWQRLTDELTQGAGAMERHEVGPAVASFVQLTHFGVILQAMRASKDLSAALQRFTAYVNEVSPDAVLQAREEDGKFCIDMLPSALSEVLAEESIDAMFFLLLRLSHHLLGHSIQPLEVHLCRAKKNMMPGAEAIYGRHVLYKSEKNSLCFLTKDCKPLETANFALAQKNDRAVSRLLDEFAKVQVVFRVKRYILEQLPDVVPTAEGLSLEMGVSKRTLQRYLTAQGITFKEVLDANRKILAHNYLSKGTKSVCELTYRLGFSDASSFCRAFKRWYGMNTSQYLFHLRQIQKSPMNSPLQSPLMPTSDPDQVSSTVLKNDVIQKKTCLEEAVL